MTTVISLLTRPISRTISCSVSIVAGRPLTSTVPSLERLMVRDSLSSLLPAVSTLGSVRFIVAIVRNCIVTNAKKISITSTSISGTRFISGRLRFFR